MIAKEKIMVEEVDSSVQRFLKERKIDIAEMSKVAKQVTKSDETAKERAARQRQLAVEMRVSTFRTALLYLLTNVIY